MLRSPVWKPGRFGNMPMNVRAGNGQLEMCVRMYGELRHSPAVNPIPIFLTGTIVRQK